MDGDKNSRKKARFYLGFYSVIIIMRHMPSFRDVGNEGGRGGHTPPTKIWAEQFTLSLNQGGQILPHQSTTCASTFSDLPTSLSFGGELSRGDRGLSVQRAGGLAIIL